MLNKRRCNTLKHNACGLAAAIRQRRYARRHRSAVFLKNLSHTVISSMARALIGLSHLDIA